MAVIKINKERKFLLIGGAILIFLGMIYRFAPDIQNLYTFDDEISSKKRKIVKYQQMVEGRKRLEAELISKHQMLERLESRLLAAETPALAAVDIQNTLNEVAKRSDVDIKSLQVLKPEDAVDERYLRIPVQFSLNSTPRQMKELVYRIESSPKFLRISYFRIRGENPRQKGQIQSSFTVEGFMKKK